MTGDDISSQERSWAALYTRIGEFLDGFGAEDHYGKADFLLVDDNYGWRRHTVELHKLHMLSSTIVEGLRALLNDFPDWEIIIVVDIPGKERVWPPMGLTIRKHEIVDGLQREFLPAEFRSLAYKDSRPGTGFD